jgi:hypothetical protein
MTVAGRHENTLCSPQTSGRSGARIFRAALGAAKEITGLGFFTVPLEPRDKGPVAVAAEAEWRSLAHGLAEHLRTRREKTCEPPNEGRVLDPKPSSIPHRIARARNYTCL